MNWFWGSGGGDDKDKHTLETLDPGLKEYLKSNTPSEYTPTPSSSTKSSPSPTARTPPTSTTPPPPSQNETSYRSFFGFGSDAKDPREAISTPPPDPAARSLPKESLFPDGRYAELWKTYRSQGEVEDAGKSEQDKLNDLFQGYRHRMAAVGRAAMENCADEQWAVSECFSKGGWASRLTMCKAENRAMDRCYTMQQRFLRALGYMSLYERSAAEREAVQMHAHALYLKMLRQEHLAAAAKARGDPVPEFEPILPQRTPIADPAAPREGVFSILPPVDPRHTHIPWEALAAESQTRLAKTKYAHASPEEQELERRAIEADIAANVVAQELLMERSMLERRERLDRLAAGNERMTDKLRRWFDFRDWQRWDVPADDAFAKQVVRPQNWRQGDSEWPQGESQGRGQSDDSR